MKQIVTTICCLVMVLWGDVARADAGKEEIGQLKVSLYLGSNDADVDAGKQAKKVDVKTLKHLSSSEAFKFENYFFLGADQQAVLRSYENWASPLKPSETILMSFEPVGKAQGKVIKLDLDLWQLKKKIMKSATTTLQVGKPLYIRGPQWRGGYLIIVVELISLK
jgi:hypothetical protein